MAGCCESSNVPSALSDELLVLKKGSDPWRYVF